MPNIRSKFIKCEFSLKATSYFDLSALEKVIPRVEIPIFITHQIQKEFEYEKNLNLNKIPVQLFAGIDLNRVQNSYNNNAGNKNNNNMNMNNSMGNNNNNNAGNNMNNSSGNQSGSSTGDKKYSYQAYIAAKNVKNTNKSQINNNINNNNWQSNSSFQPNNIK